MKLSASSAAAIALTLAAASPSLGQERQWFLDAADQDVFLVFGVAESNDVGVSFWCKMGTRKISVFTSLPSNTATGTAEIPVELKVNDVAYLLSATVNTGEKPQTIEAALVPQENIIGALRQFERFSLHIGDHVATYPLAGADFDGLVRLCSEPSAAQP